MSSKTLLWITFTAGLILTVVYHSLLPDTIASHFNISGQADAWSSKTSGTLLWLGLFVVLNLLFGFFIRWLIGKLPASLINMPNRDYWLSPERKVQTVEVLGKNMEIFTVGLNAYLMLIQTILFMSNVQSGIRLNMIGFGSVLGLFLIFVVVWIIRFFRAFRLPKA